MTSSKIIDSLVDFLLRFRRSGTTTQLKDMASKYDCWVIVATEEEADKFGKNGLALRNLHLVRGEKPKPVLIDNHVLIQLLTDADDKIKRLGGKLMEKENMLRGIKNIVNNEEYKNKQPWQMFHRHPHQEESDF